MTELIEIFLQPLRSQLAQVLIIAAFFLTFLDVLFGVGMDSSAGTQDLIVVDSVNMRITSNLQAPNGYVFNVMYLLA